MQNKLIDIVYRFSMHSNSVIPSRPELKEGLERAFVRFYRHQCNFVNKDSNTNRSFALVLSFLCKDYILFHETIH